MLTRQFRGSRRWLTKVPEAFSRFLFLPYYTSSTNLDNFFASSQLSQRENVLDQCINLTVPLPDRSPLSTSQALAVRKRRNLFSKGAGRWYAMRNRD